MRLASYKMRGRPSFGAVVGDGVVDLRSRLSRSPSLLEVFRAQALDQAKTAIAGVRPDVPLSEVELLPPLAAPEKILCIGINYANRGKDYNLAEQSEISEHVLPRARIRWSGHGQNLVRPKISEQLDYEGEIAMVIGRECKNVAKEAALEVIAGTDVVQRRHDPRLAPARPVQRHPGQELRRQRQHRALDRDRRST